MASRLSDARRSLQKAKESAQSRLVELDQERREIRTSLKSLDAALKALGNSEQIVTHQKNPAATTSEVVELTIEVLNSYGSQSTARLIELIGEKLAQRGKSRSGLSLRLKQALRDPRFIEDESGYRLQSSTSAGLDDQRGNRIGD